MYELPTTITVEGQVYHIRNKGDFRMIIDCFAALQDTELDQDYRLICALIIFVEEFNSPEDIGACNINIEALVHEMFRFMDCGQEASEGFESNVKLVDWQDDEQLICSAVNAVVNKEIRAVEYLHWWTFMGYYLSVGESVLSTVVGIRSKLARGKSLEPWESDFRKHNSRYFQRKRSEEEIEFDKSIRELWNKGGGLNGG